MDNKKKESISNDILNTSTKYNKLVNKFRNYGLIKNEKKLTYKEYIGIIFSDKVLGLFANILKMFLDKNINKSFAKSILSIYFFKNFPDKEFDVGSNLEIKLKGIVVLLINELNRIMDNYFSYVYKRIELEKLIEKYLITYLDYISEKKFNKLNMCIINFKKIENTFYYIKSLNETEMNNYIMINLRKDMKDAMDNSLELFPEFRDYIRDFTVVNQKDYNRELLIKYGEEFYTNLKNNVKNGKYDKLRKVLIDVKGRMDYYLNTTERMRFIGVMNIENIINGLEGNEFKNEELKKWINKIFMFLKNILKDYNFHYDNENFEDSLCEDIYDNFILLLKFFDKILESIGK